MADQMMMANTKTASLAMITPLPKAAENSTAGGAECSHRITIY
jgi:hypothetical protein